MENEGRKSKNRSGFASLNIQRKGICQLEKSSAWCHGKKKKKQEDEVKLR